MFLERKAQKNLLYTLQQHFKPKVCFVCARTLLKILRTIPPSRNLLFNESKTSKIQYTGPPYISPCFVTNAFWRFVLP